MKELLFKVTAKDCRWDYYKGTGSGGQAKNKTENCVRCTHIASGAVATCEDGRSKDLNKRKAFERMANTDIFQKWLKAEVSRKTGEAELIKQKVNSELLYHTTVEVQDNEGKWVPAPELAINHWDVLNMDNEE